MLRIAMLGTGFIARFYTEALHSKRSRDRVQVVYSRDHECAWKFAKQYDIPKQTTDLKEAVGNTEIDAVVVALPNHLHEPAVLAAAEAKVAVMCTKPLGRNAEEALRMLQAVENAGVFHAYLEDLVYTPKTLKALESVRNGSIGRVLWVRSRETHPGPHSAWFWNKQLSGGGALVDMGCHCIEIARSFIGKHVRPMEVMCWADTQVHNIEAEDHAIGLVRFATGAIGQFEVSWTFRGGLDLRDEVAGSEGTIWLNHCQRTGMEIFSAAGHSDYVAEKAESERGWLFPVADELAALGYIEMFTDAFDALENKRTPREDFYDGYVVNAIVDAAYKSAQTKRWEPVQLELWRGRDEVRTDRREIDFDAEHTVVKEEKLPDGSSKVILRHKQTGDITERLS